MQQFHTQVGLLETFIMMSTWSSIIFWQTSHLPLPLGENVGLGEGYVAISQNLTLIKALIFCPFLYGVPPWDLYNGYQIGAFYSRISLCCMLEIWAVVQSRGNVSAALAD